VAYWPVVSSRPRKHFHVIDFHGRDSDNPWATFISGRPLCESASSEECLSIARSWIETCRAEHGISCGQNTLEEKSGSAPFMPKRTINVGSEYLNQEPFLAIHDQNGGSGDTAWATLSHCWGGTSPLTTTKDTIKEHQRRIPLESMPRTFRDAVVIARKLGIQHVWIDSLCIVQDSDEDWRQESSHMADIYRFSVVNIAAEASRHANDGIFKPRPEDSVSVILPLTRAEHHLDGEVHICPALDNWETSMSHKVSVLATRGWVLQESLLSPRTIHYGAEQIFWACGSVILAEGDMDPPPKGSYSSSLWDWHFSKRFLKNPDTATSNGMESLSNVWYKRWYEVVMNYSKRKLTRPSDVFPALSGLAQLFHQQLEGYVAGLFKGDLHRGLLWHTSAFSQDERSPHAPTWSWASVIGTVTFEIRSGWEEVPGYKATIVDVIVNSSEDESTRLDTAIFGQIQEAVLVVEGFWRSTETWNRIKVPGNTGLWYLGDDLDEMKMSCLFDIGSNEQHIGQNFHIGEWGLLQIGTWDVHSVVDTARVLYALILRHRNGSDAFERIGIAHIYPDEDYDQDLCSGWEMRKITIV
jgi:hypothetical protein